MLRHKYTVIVTVTRKLYVNKVNIVAGTVQAAKVLANILGFMRKEIMTVRYSTLDPSIVQDKLCNDQDADTRKLRYHTEKFM